MASLATFLRDHKQEILEEWERRVRDAPSARPLDAPALRNSMPLFLEELADLVGSDGGRVDESAAEHAAQRYQHLFDLSEVIVEYRELRAAILDLFPREEILTRDHAHRLRRMHMAMDSALGAAAETFATERERERELYVAILGHDLRSPLSVVQLAMRVVLQSSDIGEREAAILSRAQNSVEEMGRMISDLLDFGRVQLGGALPVHRERLDLRPIAERLVVAQRTVNPERSIELGSSGNTWADLDGGRIEQALTNLLRNALEHGSDPIRVTVDGDDDRMLRVFVVSAGAPPEEVAASLFEGSRRVRQDGQLGLGLVIVRLVVEAHGGTIATSVRDGDLEIVLTVPRAAGRTL